MSGYETGRLKGYDVVYKSTVSFTNQSSVTWDVPEDANGDPIFHNNSKIIGYEPLGAPTTIIISSIAPSTYEGSGSIVFDSPDGSAITESFAFFWITPTAVDLLPC